MRDRVDAKEPTTLDEAKVYALEEVEDLNRVLAEAVHVRRMVDACPRDPGSAREASRPVVQVPSGDSRPMRAPSGAMPAPGRGSVQQGLAPSTQDRRPLVCFGCGAPGHKRDRCPHPSPTSFRPAVTQGMAGATLEEDVGKLVRIPAVLRSATGHISVSALLDSGATTEFISKATFDRLLEIGVLVTKSVRDVRTLGGVATSTTSVSCTLELSPQHTEVRRAVAVQVRMVVMEETSEELVLSFSTMAATGLLEFLRAQGVCMGAGAGIFDEEVEEEGLSGTLQEEEPEPSDSSLSCSPGPVQDLVREFEDLFGDIPEGGARVDPMPIDLKPDRLPRSQPPRRVSPAIGQVIEEAVKEWVRLGIVVPSRSPFSSPIVVVRKKDGSFRPCVDYRDLNDCSESMRFPLQHTKAVLERMAGMRVFGTLDLRSGFHQIPLAPEAQPLTAFATSFGLFEFTRVQFGLKNGPAYFQRAMTMALAGLVGAVCEVFVDDIIVYARDLDGFVANLRSVFDRIREHAMRINPTKCVLGVAQVDYLGHVVSGDGVALSDSRRQGIRDIKAPTTPAALKSFLGLAGYFRSFVRNFATLAKPLNLLTSDKSSFEWTDEAGRSFEAIKQAIVEAPLLHHLDYSMPIIVRTDASLVGVGGMILQVVDGVERPVAYASRAFSPVEARWSTIEQEAFGVVFAIESFQHYLQGHEFVVECDHRNLLYLHRATAPKLIRWRLQAFDYRVVHIPGRENVVADGMSRCFVGVEVAHREEIERVHNAIVGHRGERATERLLRVGGVVWSTMRHDIEEFIQACATCQKVRLGKASMSAALASTMVTDLFEVVAVDTVGPLPVDGSGMKYIISIIDCFSRFCELRAAPGATARDAAAALLDVFGRYGAPRVVRTDQGPQFTARLIETFLSLVGSRHQLTPAYRPEANGIVERANGEIGRHLRAIVMDQKVGSTWSESLPLVQRILNATPNMATGVAPARILFGDRAQLDRGLLRDFDPSMQGTLEDYVQQINERQQELLALSKAHQDKVVAKYLRKSPRTPLSFEEGDHVLVSYPDRPPSKLTPRWKGPMVIVRAVQGSQYDCQDLVSHKIVTLPISRLKPFKLDLTKDPADIAARDTQEWTVESIVDHVSGPKRRDWRFRVRWLGFEPSQDSWMTYEEAKELSALQTYLVDRPELRL